MRGMRCDGQEAEKVKPKRVRPTDLPTARDLRKRRDLVWLYLASLGMNATEIAMACLFASRSPRQIRKRLQECKRHHELKYE